MAGREGGAEGGHRLGEAVLMRHETVEISRTTARFFCFILRAHVEGTRASGLHVQRRLRES